MYWSFFDVVNLCVTVHMLWQSMSLTNFECLGYFSVKIINSYELNHKGGWGDDVGRGFWIIPKISALFTTLPIFTITWWMAVRRFSVVWHQQYIWEWSSQVGSKQAKPWLYYFITQWGFSLNLWLAHCYNAIRSVYRSIYRWEQWQYHNVWSFLRTIHQIEQNE